MSLRGICCRNYKNNFGEGTLLGEILYTPLPLCVKESGCLLGSPCFFWCPPCLSFGRVSLAAASARVSPVGAVSRWASCPVLSLILKGSIMSFFAARERHNNLLTSLKVHPLGRCHQWDCIGYTMVVCTHSQHGTETYYFSMEQYQEHLMNVLSEYWTNGYTIIMQPMM